MLRGIHRTIVSGLLAFAILLPAISQIVYKDKAAQFFCAPTGQLSTEAALAVKQIGELLNLADEGSQTNSKHCEDCVLTLATNVEPRFYKARTFFGAKTSYNAALSCGRFYFAHGPPLGSRAPPLSV